MAVDLFVVEMWTYLAICIVVGFGRVIARWKTQTFAGLKVDDFLMLLVVVRPSSLSTRLFQPTN